MEQRLSVCSAPARKRSTREAPTLEEFDAELMEPFGEVDKPDRSRMPCMP